MCSFMGWTGFSLSVEPWGSSEVPLSRGLREEGQSGGEERTSWYSAGASNSPPPLLHPEQLQFFSFIGIPSKLSQGREE